MHELAHNTYMYRDNCKFAELHSTQCTIIFGIQLNIILHPKMEVWTLYIDVLTHKWIATDNWKKPVALYYKFVSYNSHLLKYTFIPDSMQQKNSQYGALVKKRLGSLKCPKGNKKGSQDVSELRKQLPLSKVKGSRESLVASKLRKWVTWMECLLWSRKGKGRAEKGEWPGKLEPRGAES